MRVDLHGLSLKDAKLRAQISIAEAWTHATLKIELIHGHNLGTAIRDYIQANSGLSSDIKRIYPEIPGFKLLDKGLGSTIVKFKQS